MKYTCPHCKQIWTVDEQYYRGGDIFSCNCPQKTSVIPLYCPHCCPVRVEQKTWFNENPGAFAAGQEFTCPTNSKHKFRVPVTAAAAHARLRTFGSEVGQYHQGTRITTIRDAETKKAVSGGYCAGVCYDWIRRVLVSSTAKPAYRNFEGQMPAAGYEGFEQVSKQFRQDYRAALVHLERTPEKVKALAEAKNQQLVDKLNADRAAPYKIYLVEHERINDLEGTLEDKKGLYDANQRKLDQARAALQAPYDASVAAPSMAKAWEELRKRMDQAIEKQRREGHKKTLRSSRPFENLDLVAAQNEKEYSGGGLKNLITEVMDRPELLTDRCAHVGVSPPGGGTGHAVAVHRQNTGGKYHFFEPNFGTYECTKASLIDAFVYIFGTAYPYWAGGGTSDNKPYEVDGKTKGSWAIFKGNRVAAAAVVEAPLPVATRVEPSPTLTVARSQPAIAVTTQTGPPVRGTRTEGAPTAPRSTQPSQPTVSRTAGPSTNPATGTAPKPAKKWETVGAPKLMK